jgi:rhamnose transport system permease protein
VLWGVVGLRNPLFLTWDKFLFILKDTAPLFVLAAGMMCVLLVGSIDISITGIMALSAMIAAMAMRQSLAVVDSAAVVDGAEAAVRTKTGLSLLVIVLIAMGVGGLCGALNGTIIAYGRVLPVVATLGMQYILYGFSHVVSSGQAVYKKDMTDAFVAFARQDILGVNAQTWIMLLCLGLMFVFVTYFRAGRHMYAVGSNREAAEMRGIKSQRTIMLAHIIMGVLAGLAGVMFGSHDTKITQDLKMGYEMYVIAACVIGGVSVTGGVGKITAVLLGALVIGVINNGLPMMRLTGDAEFWKKLIQGLLILIAVISNVVLRRVSVRRELKGRKI